MKGFILAAGPGTRLRPHTLNVPKPLFPVLGVPLIQWVRSGLVSAGVSEVIINLYYLGDRIVDELNRWPAFGVRTVFSPESTVLGTGGGLVNAADLLGSDDGFMLHNGDIFTSAGPDVLDGSGDVPVLGCVDGPGLPEEDRRVEIATGRVLSIRGLPGSGNGRKVVYGGMAWITREVIETLADSMSISKTDQACLVKDGLIPIISAGREIRAVCHEDRWYCDIGTAQSYLELNRRALRDVTALLSKGGFDLPEQFEENIFVAPGASIGARACLKGPVLVCKDAVIGAGATVGPDVTVCGSVEAGAEVRDAVVMRGATAAGCFTGILAG